MVSFTVRGILIMIAIVGATFVLQLVKIGYFRRRSRGVQEALVQQVNQLLGEQNSVKRVVPCQEGVHPLAGTFPFLDNSVKDRVLISTDSSLLLFSCYLDFARVDTRLFKVGPEPVKVLYSTLCWTRVQVSGRKLWVHRRFRADLRSMGHAGGLAYDP
jgi:hypothetical protein